MQVTYLLLIILLSSCTHHQGRFIASEAQLLIGEVDQSKSSIQLYPHEEDQNFERFYIELRDINGLMTDTDLESFRIISPEKPAFFVRRISAGRYELVTQKEIEDFSDLRFEIQKKKFKHKLMKLQKPSKLHSRIIVLNKNYHSAIFRLVLRDKQNKAIETLDAPEIILEGEGELSLPVRMTKGIWEFQLTHSEQNQLFYLSVRANGTSLVKILRFQHVEDY